MALAFAHTCYQGMLFVKAKRLLEKQQGNFSRTEYKDLGLTWREWAEKACRAIMGKHMGLSMINDYLLLGQLALDYPALLFASISFEEIRPWLKELLTALSEVIFYAMTTYI